MVWEGMVTEGLAVTRAVHDRYHPSRRNPWNEVECGDHYARSMASYGVFLAACGYEYDGPKAALAFAPRLTPENFKAPFTAAEGWGSYSQKTEGASWKAELEVKYGRLRVKTVALALVGKAPSSVKVKAGGKRVESRLEVKDGKVVIALLADAVIGTGQKLEIVAG